MDHTNIEESFSIILKTLKAFIRNETTEGPDDRLWDQTGELARIHGITGILYYVWLNSSGNCFDRNHVVMKNVCLRFYAKMALKAEQMTDLSNLLTRAGIDHLAFKGYIVRNCYPVPELRTFGDVDILIHPTDRRKCHDLLVENGFQCSHDWEPVYSYIKGNSLFEFHTELLDTDISEKVTSREFFRKDPWKYAVNIEGRLWTFQPEYHFLYLITHIAKHISSSGAGIRMYMDLALFIKQYPELDWNWIQKTLQDIGLDRSAAYMFALIEEYFGTIIPISYAKPSHVQLAAFLEYTMEAGIFGTDNRDSAIASLHSFGGGETSDRKKALLQFLFPSADKIETRYTYLKGRHWLLPAAWIHRIILNLNNTGRHVQDAKKMLSVDEKEVKRIQNIRDDLGL